MKKLLLLLCTMLAFVAGNTVKAEVILWQEDFSSYEADAVPAGGTYKYVCADNGANLTKIYGENIAGGTAPELLIGKYNSKTSNVHGSFSATVPMNGKSGEMVLSFKRNNKSLTVTATGATLGKSTRTGNTDEYPVTVTAGTAEVTFTFTAGSDNVRFDDVKLYQGEALKPAGLSWGTASREAFLDKSNEENKIPVLTNSNNLPVTYGSSDTNVATITAEGAVTLVGTGKSTISAAFAGNDVYEAQTVTYELTVKASEAVNTLETAFTVAQAHEFITAGEDLTSKVYVKGIITKIDDIDTEGTYGNATYYIGDTADDDQPLEVYRGFGLNGQKFNEEGATLIKKGDVVVVYGKVKDFDGTHEFDASSKIVSLNPTPAPAPIVFTDQLTVTVNDVSGTLDASVNLIKHEDGTIDFSLPNFVLAYGEDVMPVGNININGLTLVPGEQYDSFSYDGPLAISAGDLEGIDFWMGPALGEMPLKLQGKVNFDDHKLFVNIDIDLTESLSQIINVKFGTDFEEPAEKQFVLGPEDVSANKAYIIYTEARGGLTVVGEEATALNGTSEAGVGQTVEDTNVLQQFAFVGYEGDYYLYSLGAKKYVSVSGLTEKAANPVQFADADESTVRLYLDGSHNFNLGGSKQFTCDGWKYKDAGNSFIIKAVADFDQTALVEAIAADIQQSKLNAALAEAIAEAQAAYDIHNIAGDALIHEADQFSSPYTTTDDQCDDIDEVYTYLLDNDAKTYWHSAWEEGEQPMHTHYLQVNLAELVDGDMLLQMTRRNVLGNHITKMSVEASTDGVDFTQVAAFELPYNAGGEVVSAEFKLDTPATFLRFFADETAGNEANAGYWHAAEFQLFKAIDLPRNVINADVAAALLEAIETAKTVENATQEDVDALVQALSLYNANIMNEPVVPVEPDTETMYFTAEQLRNEVANIGQALIGVLNVTTTADKYVTETLRSSEASADGTLAGVRAPQEEEVFEVLAAEGGYVLRHHNAAEGEGYLGLNGNTFTVTDQAGATIWTILGPDEEGYGSVTSFDDLYPDIAAELNPNMVRFIAQGQYLNGQNFENIGGIRGGTGAWSFNYVRNANYEEETPEVITYTIKFVNAPEDGAYLQIGGNWYSEGETVESETELTAEDVTVSCDPAYTYEISIENGVITVTFQKPDGISAMTTDNRQQTIYNLQGQQVGTAFRGIYLQNRKKVLVK